MTDIRNQILQGDVIDRLQDMPEQSVNCVVTSPPYWGLRDYGVAGQIGLEETPEAFVDKMVAVFMEVWRVLKDDGTLWLNMGDSYATGGRGGEQMGHAPKAWLNGGAPRGWHNAPAGLKHKDLCGIPWRVALALQSAGWYLRSDIIWSKPNPMPESVTDRPTKAHEYLFLLTKKPRYYCDMDAIREPLAEKKYSTFGTTRKSKGNDAGGFVKSDNYSKSVPIRKPKLKEDGTPAGANKKTVWTVSSTSYKGAHFATFPPALIEPCIKAGCPGGGIVLDPFFGAGTTGLVAKQLGRDFVGIELNPEYVTIAKKRLQESVSLLMVG